MDNIPHGAKEALLAATRDDIPEVRNDSALVLTRFGSEPDIVDALLNMLEMDDTSSRNTAVIAIGIYKLLKKAIEIFRDNIPKWKGTIIKPIKIKTIEVLSAERIVDISQQLLRGFQILINLILLYIFIPIVFSFFDFSL